MEHEILPCLSQPFGQVLERLLPPSCSACSGSVGSAPLGKGWFPQAAGEGMGMVRWQPGAQESRDLQESCAAAAVLCPGLQVKTPLSTVHRPPRAPQVRSPSGPTRSSARVGSSPSCPSSFHISLVMPWLKTPCSHVMGLPRDYGDRAGADMLLGPLATLAHLPAARKSGHICVPW